LQITRSRRGDSRLGNDGAINSDVYLYFTKQITFVKNGSEGTERKKGLSHM